jgi:hypothetical protein
MRELTRFKRSILAGALLVITISGVSVYAWLASPTPSAANALGVSAKSQTRSENLTPINADATLSESVPKFARSPSFSVKGPEPRSHMTEPLGSEKRARALTEQEVAGMDLAEVWKMMESARALEDHPPSVCALTFCPLFRDDLEHYHTGLLGESISADHIAYIGAMCSVLIADSGEPIDLRPLEKICHSKDYEKVIAGEVQLSEQLIDGAAPTEFLLDILQSEDKPLGLKMLAAARALKDSTAFEGIRWDEVRGELFEESRVKLAWLLAAKQFCRDAAACRPRSFLLFQLCHTQWALDCQINSDLRQIARDSLTPREFRWWENAFIPEQD